MSGAPYIVWTPDGETPPVVAHKSHKKALWVAWHMAAKHPGKQFYVMARVGKGALAQGIVTATADETRSGSVERSEIEPGPATQDAPETPHQDHTKGNPHG